MSSQLINQVLELTNAERANAGLNPLTLNTKLSQAAEGHSDSMANDDFFSHTGANGSSVGARVQDTGYQYSTVGENIAAGQTTAEEVVQGWMNSPGHRANILNANYTEIGLGYEYLANDTGSVNYNHYWTQVFGTPSGNNSNAGASNQDVPAEENNDVVPVEENSDPNTTENLDTIDTDISGAETEADNVDSTPVEESNDSLDNSDLNSMDSMDSGVDESVAPENDYFDGDLTGTSGNSVMTGGDNSVNFSNDAESLDKLENGDLSFSDVSDLLSNYGLGNISIDTNDFDSLITEYMSNADLSGEEKQLLQENMESFL